MDDTAQQADTPLRPPSYWDYIRVEELLDLQGGREDDEGRLSNEEVLFITVHQVFELWFKLILRELRSARDLFTADPVAEQELSGAVGRLQRVLTILRAANKHWEVMETLPTREFLEFRDKLIPASGFQSGQMREIEIVMGLTDEERIPLGLEGDYLDRLREKDGSESSSFERVKRQLEDGPTLCEAIDEWLFRTPIDGSSPTDDDATERLDSFVERFLDAHQRQVRLSCEQSLDNVTKQGDAEKLMKRYEAETNSVKSFLSPTPAEGGMRRRRIRVAALFIETYRELPLLAWPREVIDSLVAVEQAFIMFRQRHARMVERVIGRRTGTGGSAGVDYLDTTALRYRVFRDLWAVRTLQIRRSAAPELEQPGFYGFRVE